MGRARLVAPRAQRTLDLTERTTEQLPINPTADRNIPAEAWIDAPDELLRLGESIGENTVVYLRQMGPFLLWRAGEGRTRSNSIWMALDLGDLDRRFTFRQSTDGTGEGIGPSGEHHQRFRTWKEDLHTDGRGGADGQHGATDEL